MKTANIARATATKTATTKASIRESNGDPNFSNFRRGVKTTGGLLQKDTKAFWRDWMAMDSPHKVVSWGLANFVASFAATWALTKLLIAVILGLIKFCQFVADRTR